MSYMYIPRRFESEGKGGTAVWSLTVSFGRLVELSTLHILYLKTCGGAPDWQHGN